MIVTDDEEARWDFLKRKEDDKGWQLPSSCNNDRKHVKASKKKPGSALSKGAEEFQMERNISKVEYQKKSCDRICLYCGSEGHYVDDCKVYTPSSLGKGRQS